MKRLILIISGPSGVGKSTLLAHLPKEEFYFSVSHTTRKPRPGEVDGKDYYFVTKDTFMEMLQRNEFLEWIQVHSNFYGTASSEVEKAFSLGKHLVFDVEVIGASNLRRKFGQEAISIFIAPPTLSVLEERLKNRGTENDEKIRERLQRASLELTYLSFFDYVVVNDDLDQAKASLLAIVRAELSRPWRCHLGY